MAEDLKEVLRKAGLDLHTLLAEKQYSKIAHYILDKEGQGVTLENIITMNWLSANIEGTIPEYEQLSDEGKETVESAGAPTPLSEEKADENTGDC